jgi:dienelactone hydrolase
VVVPPRRNGALAVFVHGSGEDRRTMVDDRRHSGVARDLVEHGYVVLAADAGGRAWGDAASVADYRALIARTVRDYGLHDVFLMAESMGGLAAMQLARSVPDVRAVTAWYPVYDLRTMATKHRFAGWIARAWAGADRSVVSPVAVPRVPMMIWASAHDTVVSAALNARRLAAAERAAGGTVVYSPTAGNHGDPSNFRPAAVVRFFDDHRSHPQPGAAPATGTRKA